MNISKKNQIIHHEFVPLKMKASNFFSVRIVHEAVKERKSNEYLGIINIIPNVRSVFGTSDLLHKNEINAINC